MNNLLPYLAESGLALLLFYVVYVLLLSRQTCFAFNRFYLLAALLFSFIIPFLELPTWPAEPAVAPGTTAILVQPEATQPLNETPIIEPKATETVKVNYSVYLYYLYATGFIVALLLFCRQFIKLNKFIYRHLNKAFYWRGIKIIPTDGEMATFSFLRYIFFDNSQALTPTEKELIFRHEQAHLQQKHSLDILMVKLLNTIFWFNPLLYLYQKALENTHEYLADAQVVQRQDAETYAALLVQQVFFKTGFSLGSSFHLNKSLTLKRIAMLKKSNFRASLTRPLLAIPVVCALALIFASNRPVEVPKVTSSLPDQNKTATATTLTERNINNLPGGEGPNNQLEQPALPGGEPMVNALIKPQYPISQEPLKEKVYTYVDGQGPSFPITKEAIEKYKAAKIKPVAGGYAELALQNFIKENLKYPAEAVKAKIEGIVVAQVVVDRTGNIRDSKIVKGLTKETDAEALRVIKLLPDFVPARHEGKPVAFLYALPVRFALPK